MENQETLEQIEKDLCALSDRAKDVIKSEREAGRDQSVCLVILRRELDEQNMSTLVAKSGSNESLEQTLIAVIASTPSLLNPFKNAIKEAETTIFINKVKEKFAAMMQESCDTDKNTESGESDTVPETPATENPDKPSNN
jgi:hypothetical protein